MNISSAKTDPDIKAMLSQAAKAMKNAYAPYSGYRAGAIIRLRGGDTYAACNVENASYLGYESAEAVLGCMISACDWAAQGHIPEIESVLFCVTEFEDSLKHLPSGASLGHLRAFGRDDTPVYFATEAEGVRECWTLGELLPNSPKIEHDRKQLERRARELLALRGNQISATPAFLETEIAQLNYIRLQSFNLYSEYSVGALVKTTCGKSFYGCNYESGPHISVHAEGVAICRMIAALGPAAKIASVTIMTEGTPGFPCGDCRQKINEFAVAETQVIGINTNGEQYAALHTALLPRSFGPENLEAAAGVRARA